jgi:hypothetical protein
VCSVKSISYNTGYLFQHLSSQSALQHPGRLSSPCPPKPSEPLATHSIYFKIRTKTSFQRLQLNNSTTSHGHEYRSTVSTLLLQRSGGRYWVYFGNINIVTWWQRNTVQLSRTTSRHAQQSTVAASAYSNTTANHNAQRHA